MSFLLTLLLLGVNYRQRKKMISAGLAAAFDYKLLLMMLGVLYGVVTAACTFGSATSDGSAAGRSLPGVGG